MPCSNRDFPWIVLFITHGDLTVMAGPAHNIEKGEKLLRLDWGMAEKLEK